MNSTIDVCNIDDPILRNLRINRCYHQLSEEMSAALGAPRICNWATYGQHASRDVGLYLYRSSPEKLRYYLKAMKRDPVLTVTQTVREAIELIIELPRQLRAFGPLLRLAYNRALALPLESLESLPAQEHALRALLEREATIPAAPVSLEKMDGDDDVALEGLDRSSRLTRTLQYFLESCDKLRNGMADGNLRIFKNIAHAYRAFLASAQTADAVRQLCFENDDRGFLAQAFVLYAQARTTQIARRAELIEQANLLIACQEQLVIAQPIFDEMLEETAAITRSLSLHDPEGKHPVLPNGGSWANFFERMGFVCSPAAALTDISAARLPPLLDLQSPAAVGSIAWYMHVYLHSPKLHQAPAPLPFLIEDHASVLAPQCEPSGYSDSQLDEFRTAADPAADAVVEYLLGEEQIKHGELWLLLTDNQQSTPLELYPPLVQFFAQTAELPPWRDESLMRIGCSVFGKYGPQIVLSLLCAALPASYAARNGVQVLGMTGRLLRDSQRRIIETAQFVVDVMAPSGLFESGRGVRSAQKVRLIHAVVRHLVLRHTDWDLKWGRPINQEDLVGTMLVFSSVVLECLPKLGCHLSEQEKEGYLHVWKVTGHLMGIDERLQPPHLASARRLAQRIRTRQCEASKEGKALTAALIDFCEPMLGESGAPGRVAQLMRFLLDGELAEMLGVPLTDKALELPPWVKLQEELGQNFPGWMREVWGRKLVEALLRMYRGPERYPFIVPQQLQAAWGMGEAELT